MVTIHLEQHDFDKISRWLKNHREIVGNVEGKFPYNEFAIKLELDKDFPVSYTVSLEENDVNKSLVKYRYKNTVDVKYIVPKNDYQTMKEEHLQAIENNNEYKAHECSAWNFYIALMTYLMHKLSRRKITVVESDKEINSNTAKTVKSPAPKKDKNFLLDDFVVYKHKMYVGKSKTFTCESWGVKGHYRHLKSGKVVWVKDYVKGDKNKKTDKDIYLSKK